MASALMARAAAVRDAFFWKTLSPTVVSKTGIHLTLTNRSDWDIFSEIWIQGEYDSAISRAFEACSPDKTVTIVDLGANIGLFSLRCLELARSSTVARTVSITAVEGVPRVWRLLRRNLQSLDTIGSSLTAHLGIVGGQRNGVANIYDGTYRGANTVVPKGGPISRLPFRGAHAVTGRYIDLDDIVPRDAIVDLLKCDIEGSEGALLASYEDLLKRTRVVVIELHPLHCDPAECRRLLARYGFRTGEVLRTTPTIILETYVRQ